MLRLPPSSTLTDTLFPYTKLFPSTMGLLTFSINVTLDGCVDHQEGIADDETHAFFTGLMDECGAMLWGRVTYEMMESYWPAVARGDVEAPPAMREWRSEEHTSELQSLMRISYAVFCLKKKKN